MANLSRKAMREYQRERRARLRNAAASTARVERPSGPARNRPEAVSPVVDKALPCNPIATASATEAASVKARIAPMRAPIHAPPASIRPPAPARALSARSAPSPPSPTYRPPAAPLSRALTVPGAPLQGEIMPPPRSMIADGGTEPRRYAPGASIADATAMIRALAFEQGRVNAEMVARLAAVEKVNVAQAAKIAALEEKRSRVIAIVQGATGLAMSLMFGMRED